METDTLIHFKKDIIKYKMNRVLSYIFVLGLGFMAGYFTHSSISQPIKPEPITVRDTIIKRDTVEVPGPIRHLKPDSIYVDYIKVSMDSSAIDSTIHTISDTIKTADLNFNWSAKLGCLNNQPKIFDLSYKYNVICSRIIDSIFIRETTTVPYEIKKPINHLSIGVTATMPSIYQSIDVKYHHSWYYGGISVGSAALTPGDNKLFFGISAGININL